MANLFSKINGLCSKLSYFIRRRVQVSVTKYMHVYIHKYYKKTQISYFKTYRATYLLNNYIQKDLKIILQN